MQNGGKEAISACPMAKHLVERDGFVLPVVIFAMLVMSTVVVASFLTAGDEQRSARALRESGLAFYTAERGLNEVWAAYDDSLVLGLAPGDSVDLGWQTLDGSGSYRAVIHRYDNGGQPSYGLVVTGRSRSGAWSGERSLSIAFTRAMGRGYQLGGCCDAAAKVRGEVQMMNPWSPAPLLDGHDHVPTGWDDVCPDSLVHKPGLIVGDGDGDDDIEQSAGTIDGEPPIVHDESITADAWDEFGELTYEELRDMATHDLRGTGGSQDIYMEDVGPRYNADGSCDTSHSLNWGSSDPNDPCFDFFPIILIGRRELDTEVYDNSHMGYGQGIIVLDWDEGSSVASEFDVRNLEFRGIILGRGCIELQGKTVIHGAVFSDGDYYGGCDANGESAYKQEQSGTARYSQCAVDRAIFHSGLWHYATADEPGGAQRLERRAFREILR